MKLRVLFVVAVALLMQRTASADLMGIVFNELLADPTGATSFDTDGDGTAEVTDEFIEIYNTSLSAVDISGWNIFVSSGGFLNLQHTFAPGTILDPGEILVAVNEWDPGALPAGFVELDGGGVDVFDDDGDNITLFDPVSFSYTSYIYNGGTDLAGAGMPVGSSLAGSIIDMGDDIDGMSISASPDGSTNWIVKEPTPGKLNFIPEPSSVAVLALIGVSGLVYRRRRRSAS